MDNIEVNLWRHDGHISIDQNGMSIWINDIDILRKLIKDLENCKRDCEQHKVDINPLASLRFGLTDDDVRL